MGIMPDTSPYGSQTVTGPGWPNVDEDALAAAVASYEALAAKLTGSVVPLQQGQLMKLSDSWKGGGALAATGEASTIIGAHEANAAHAAAIAVKLRSMEVTVAKTKALLNATAEETQQECEAIQARPFSNTQELVQSRQVGPFAEHRRCDCQHDRTCQRSGGATEHSAGRSSPNGTAATRGRKRFPAGDADAQSDGLHGGSTVLLLLAVVWIVPWRAPSRSPRVALTPVAIGPCDVSTPRRPARSLLSIATGQPRCRRVFGKSFAGHRSGRRGCRSSRSL